MNRYAILLTAAIILAGLPACARADKVVMKNGDVITCKISEISGGRLKARIAYAGDVEIDFAEVASFTTDDPLGIEVAGGNRVVGPVEYTDGARASVKAEAGVFEFAASDLVSVGPVEIPEPEKPRWHGAFEIGVGGQTGNKETFRGNAKFTAKRETEDLLLLGYAWARYSKEDGEVSDNVQRVGGRTEQKFGQASFWYTALDLERDEFKDLDLRATGSAGLGRTWWKEDGNFWKTAVGVGFTHESYSTGDNDIFPVAELTSDYGRRLNSKVVFTDTTKVIPSLDDIDAVRAENDAALSIDLSDKGDLKLKLGMLNQYDNAPQNGIDRLDTYYYLNFVKEY